MLYFIAFLLSSALGAQSVSELCGNTKPQSMITSPLARNSDHEWCYSGVCEEDHKTFERSKCVKQIVDGEAAENHFMVLHKDVHLAHELASYKNYGAFYRLYPEDSCFSECRPENKEFLGINTGRKSGIEKEVCVKCLIKLSTIEPDSYAVVGHGVTVYQGQRCHSLCKLPAGVYLDHRPYSTECLTCIGAMGIKPLIEHLVNAKGECFELREGQYRGVSKVPEQFCRDQNNIFTTFFKKSSKYSMDSLLFKKPQVCYEVDDKTGGNYYKRTVPMEKCEQHYADDSQRGNTKDTSSPLVKKSPNSSARKN